MLNISGIKEGVVLDHIQAGKSMEIYKYLGLGKMDCTVAIIKNARSSKMGRKDIIKIEGPLDSLDLDVLGYIDHTITVNIITVFSSICSSFSDIQTFGVLTEDHDIHVLKRSFYRIIGLYRADIRVEVILASKGNV